MSSNYNPEVHHRRSIRLKGYDYSKEGYYFITITLKSVACMFAISSGNDLILTEVGKIAQKFWQEITLHYPHVELDEYVIMPDHLHGILRLKSRCKSRNKRFESKGAPCKGVQLNALTNQYYSKISPKGRSLPVIIRNYKSTVKSWCNKNGHPQFKWHRNYYERIIRNEDELIKIRQYIKNNPAKLTKLSILPLPEQSEAY